jgi:hypothetical protein
MKIESEKEKYLKNIYETIYNNINIHINSSYVLLYVGKFNFPEKAATD